MTKFSTNSEKIKPLIDTIVAVLLLIRLCRALVGLPDYVYLIPRAAVHILIPMPCPQSVSLILHLRLPNNFFVIHTHYRDETSEEQTEIYEFAKFRNYTRF